MIPITLAVLGAKDKGTTRFKGFLTSLCYVLGIATTYSVLGLIAASTGSLFWIPARTPCRYNGTSHTIYIDEFQYAWSI